MGALIVTGAAGFLGRAVCERLLATETEVVGIDDFNAYYDPALKRARAETLLSRPGFRMIEADIADHEAMAWVLAETRSRIVVHLAAQAGVRHSLEAPFAYEHSNLRGHLSILEACRKAGSVEHLVYASSSSVYGDRGVERGFSEDDAVDSPVSLYAATKRGCEVMSAAYASLYGLPQTGLRFFTVYGPWGRPDMSYSIFTRKILAGETIELYGEGRMARDFTFVDDAVEAVAALLERPPEDRGHRLLNVGSGTAVPLTEMVATLERALGRQADIRLAPRPPGDVFATWASIDRLHSLTGYRPAVRLEEGLPRFVAWWLASGGRWP